MDNLEKKIRQEGDYYCSSCHRSIDEYDYECIEDNRGREEKWWGHEDVTVRDSDGEYVCKCNHCDEEDSVLITRQEVEDRNKIMYGLVTKVLKKIDDHEKKRALF